jgi:hypothetical protein
LFELLHWSALHTDPLKAVEDQFGFTSCAVQRFETKSEAGTFTLWIKPRLPGKYGGIFDRAQTFYK